MLFLIILQILPVPSRHGGDGDIPSFHGGLREEVWRVTLEGTCPRHSGRHARHASQGPHAQHNRSEWTWSTYRRIPLRVRRSRQNKMDAVSATLDRFSTLSVLVPVHAFNDRPIVLCQTADRRIDALSRMHRLHVRLADYSIYVCPR